MKRKKSMLIIFSLLFLIVFTSQAKEKETQANVAYPLLPIATIKKVTLLTIDLAAKGKITLRDVLYGNDSILTFNVNDNGNKKTKTRVTLQDLAIIPTPEVLAKLDENADGRIDLVDKVFKSLYLVTLYQDGKRYRIMPAAKAGIRAIFLPLQILRKTAKKEEQAFTASNADRVILADNSARKIQYITIDAQILRSLATFKFNQ